MRGKELLLKKERPPTVRNSPAKATEQKLEVVLTTAIFPASVLSQVAIEGGKIVKAPQTLSLNQEQKTANPSDSGGWRGAPVEGRKTERRMSACRFPLVSPRSPVASSGGTRVGLGREGVKGCLPKLFGESPKQTPLTRISQNARILSVA